MKPEDFERNLDAVRQTMKLAAQSDLTSAPEKKAAGEEFDQVLDLYLQMFRTGDVNAEGGHLRPPSNELN